MPDPILREFHYPVRVVNLVGASDSRPPSAEDLPETLELQGVDAWWRAANYLSVGQLHLDYNALLERPLRREDIKRRRPAHWGVSPGLNFVYAHLNRIIRQRDLNMILVAGTAQGGPALIANAWLEGMYSEIYPEMAWNREGLRRLFRQFSFPAAVPGHSAPETPGSIHEGGEPGHALSHAFGTVFDNPDLVAACVVGEAEVETGSLAASWHSTKFLNPARDGVVLPILYLGDGKASRTTVQAPIPRTDLEQLLHGCGWQALIVEAGYADGLHRQMAQALDLACEQIGRIKALAGKGGEPPSPRWPMIVLRAPQAWAGPPEIEGSVEAAQPLPHAAVPVQPEQLEAWMRSFRPQELFGADGSPSPPIAKLAPHGDRRMSANPHANGGRLLHDLHLPNLQDYAMTVDDPGNTNAEATRALDLLLRDVLRSNPDNFRVFSRDHGAIVEAMDRCFMRAPEVGDDRANPEGRVTEASSGQQCQGWLEGYLLSGRHGIHCSNEALVHAVDAMFNQHSNWLKIARGMAWRRPVASLNYLLTSHVWRQGPEGRGHHDPGFLDRVANQSADLARIYLPPDANSLLAVTDRCLRSRGMVNVVVASREPTPHWLTMDQAVAHCERGIGIWGRAGCPNEPDVVMACCGDVPTLETLAAVDLLRVLVPELRLRVVNVVDLMRLQPAESHPHGLDRTEFIGLFTFDRPVVFAFHGHPSLIHRLVYTRGAQANFHVHGFRGEGSATTPFDLAVRNGLDRFHLALGAVQRAPRLTSRVKKICETLNAKLAEHAAYIRSQGEDLPDVRNWRWRS
ncbi:MAG: phosphoketolase [Panacagrimonas sp.]